MNPLWILKPHQLHQHRPQITCECKICWGNPLSRWFHVSYNHLKKKKVMCPYGQRCQLVDLYFAFKKTMSRRVISNLCNLESNHSFDLHKKCQVGLCRVCWKGVFGVAEGVLMPGLWCKGCLVERLVGVKSFWCRNCLVQTCLVYKLAGVKVVRCSKDFGECKRSLV